jgi:hypothetical protein
MTERAAIGPPWYRERSAAFGSPPGPQEPINLTRIEVLALIVGFLGGSATATLLQVRAEWRRRRADRLIAGAEALLTAVEGAIAALDRVAEAGGNLYETERKVKATFGEIGKAGRPFTKTSGPPEIQRFADLLAEVQERPTALNEQEAAAERARIERVEREISIVLNGMSDSDARRDALQLGRALNNSALARIGVQENHLAGHRAIDAARRQRSRLAIAVAGVATGSDVLKAADRVVEALHSFREATDNAILAAREPRTDTDVISARAECGRVCDAFAEEVAEAVEGRSSRRWRWQL